MRIPAELLEKVRAVLKQSKEYHYEAGARCAGHITDEGIQSALDVLEAEGMVLVDKNTLQNIRTFSRKAVYDASKRKKEEDVELFNYIVGRMDAAIAASVKSGGAS